MLNPIALKSWWRNLDPVWRWNTRHARGLAGAMVDDRNLFDVSLQDQGIATIDLTADLLTELVTYKDSITKKYENPRKPFLIEYWPTGGVLDFANPFVTKVALNPKILAVVTKYLGCWPRLYDYRLWETKVVPETQQKIYSQSWHRDPEDRKLLNVFIYLNDVLDIGTGPFHYIPKSQRGGIFQKEFPQLLPPKASYPGDRNVEERFSKDQIMVCIAPAGTLIFADTAGLHKGGFSTKKPRLMSKCLYITDGNFKRHKTRYSLPKNLPSDLTKQQLYAIGAI